jgi:hypothetical protein
MLLKALFCDKKNSAHAVCRGIRSAYLPKARAAWTKRMTDLSLIDPGAQTTAFNPDPNARSAGGCVQARLRLSSFDCEVAINYRASEYSHAASLGERSSIGLLAPVL